MLCFPVGYWSRFIVVGMALLAVPSDARSSRSRQKDEIRYECRVMEDAEDGDTAGWDLWDNDPPGEWRLAVDPDNRKNHAIQLLGVFETCYRFTFPTPQEDATVIQWRMRLDEARYYEYVVCETSEGVLNIRYAPGDPNRNGGLVDNDPVINLGNDVEPGVWHTVRRDVLADLRTQYPRIAVLSIRSVMFRGSGYIDDIRVYSYPDADHDLLPDDFEKRRKLDAMDPADATARLIAEVMELTDPVEGRSSDTETATKKKDKEQEDDEASAPSESLHHRVVLSEAERTEMELFYEDRFAEHLATIPPPQVGKTYRVRMREGEEVVGELTEFAEGRITLRTTHGSITVPIHRVNRRDSAALFPQEAARQLALQDVQRHLDELVVAKVKAGSAVVGTAGPATPTTVAAVPVGPVPAVMEPETAAVRDEAVEPPAYDPRPAPTPEALKPTMVAFAEWLKVQQHRAGARIADRLFAKDQSGNAVLYLGMAPAFLAQDYDIRHRTAVGIQQFWSFRCQAMGVADLASAHVVLLDGDGRVVGGSRPEDAADIWVNER